MAKRPTMPALTVKAGDAWEIVVMILLIFNHLSLVLPDADANGEEKPCNPNHLSAKKSCKLQKCITFEKKKDPGAKCTETLLAAPKGCLTTACRAY